MSIVTTATYCLIMITIVLMGLLYLVLKKISISDKVGLEKNLSIPSSLLIEDLEGNNVSLFENKKKIIYLLLDIDCGECKKILKKLDLLNDRYFENIRLLIVKNNNNTKEIKKSSHKNRTFLIDERLLEQFEIKGFPLYIKVDPSKKLISKGLINVSNILNLVELEDSIL
ncbi:hypothetical protein MHB44_13415 [Lysinibacillus sp. FSL H8-0500]|uniref:Thioredoxin domain-containing protein n=1 Tax=Lysinibacillus macroides TaxID=33935 RepID=A0A0N0CWK2_9BACI|nr:hypothetical protein [Lysinibacillus macroides]KOY83255.1 hypothetical protein ADM90_08240 [Lysinibacillus macroides]QPR69116.1 hypothetical protein I6G82_05745 [Lysinibacillus macroides]